MVNVVLIRSASLLFMLAVRRCCVSAWVAALQVRGRPSGLQRRSVVKRSLASSSLVVSKQHQQPSLMGVHPLLLHYRGGSSGPQKSSFSLHATVSQSSESGVTKEAELFNDPEYLKQLRLGGGFTCRQFGGLSYWDTSSLSKFRVMFVLGGPGAGKGTQSALMEEHYPVVHLSVGQLLRDEQSKEGSLHRDLIEQSLVAGQIVPVEISLQLVQEAMNEAASIHGDQILFLIDGFPRNFDNVAGWARVMPETAALAAVLVYQCPLQVLEGRILERAKVSGRSDDNLASVKKRFATFQGETTPVIDTLRKAADFDNKQWSVVDVKGDKPLEDVWIASQQILNELILHDVLTANAALLRAVEAGDVAQYQKVCDDEWFVDKDAASVMEQQEGSSAPIGDISKAQLDFISGKHVAVSYDRVMQGEHIREKRIWSHQGVAGWRNIHFARTPMPVN